MTTWSDTELRGCTIEETLSMGGDLSAPRRTAWFYLRGGELFSIDMGCAAGVVGTVSIEVCNHGIEGVAGTPIAAFSEWYGLAQPDGVLPWSCLVDDIITAAKYVAVVWTPTSGGAEKYLTNGAHEEDTGPKIVVKGLSLSAEIVSAEALDLRTVRVTFSAPVDATALDPDSWVFAGTSTPPFAVPTVDLTDGVDSDTSPTIIDLGLSFDLTPGATYRVSAVDVIGVETPYNTADFTAPALPVVAGRLFSFLRWIPEMNIREDDTQDLRNFVSVAEDLLRLLLHDVDRFGEIQDPDLAPDYFLDRMIEDFGNPVEDAALVIEKKRIWMKSMVALYKQIGTVSGLRAAIRFFLGFEIDVVTYNRQGMRLRLSLLALDWILGAGDDRCHLLIKVGTPEGRAFTDYEERVLAQILALMSYAHEEIQVQAALPAPTNVVASANGAPEGILVSWNAVAGAVSYAVYMRSIAGVTVLNSQRNAAAGTSLVLEMLPDQHRYFVVTAVNAQGDGLMSIEVDATSD